MSTGTPWVSPPSGRNAQTFDSPTFTGNAIRDRYPLACGGIPLIGLSSGSVSAGGAISGITALPLAYPDAYCWFPANILAASIAAGWYYCTFSSTTAGTAFLNTYTSGVPTIPASPTAVTAGQGAFTGDLTEEMAHQITVPANALGTNGVLSITTTLQLTNNANAKTWRLRFSGTGGTIIASSSDVSNTMAARTLEIVNTGSAAKQISKLVQASFVTPTANVLSTVDTTASTTLVQSIQRGTATDNIVLLPPTVEIIRLS